MSSCEGCLGYHGHAWPITCPRSRGRLTERRVPNPPARRHSPCPLPSGPSVHHLLHPLSLAAGLPPPSPLALLLLVALSSLFSGASPARCHPSRLLSSLLWVTVTVTWPVCLLVCTLSSWASPVLHSSWSDCTRALFSSSLLPFHLTSAPDPCGCQGKAHGVLRASPVWRPCSAFASPLHRRFFCFHGSHAPCGSHLHLCPPPLGPAATTLEPPNGARRFPNIGRGPTTTPRRACHLHRSVCAV